MGAQKQSQKSHTLAPGTVLKGRYRLDLLAGAGGMAVVYRAFDSLNGDALVAVKQLRLAEEFDEPGGRGRENFKQYEKQFDNESEFLQRLRHPNIPLYIDHFSESGRRFLVQEFVQGQTLESLCRGMGVPEAMALPWLLQVCEVLGYLHGQNPPVIYRDLKPSNLMLSVDGRVKLLDFGIARTFKPGKHHDTVYMGSEPYAAPEAYGLDQTDPRSDVFGWGKTAYHLLTGEEPAKGAIPDPRARAPALSQGIVDVIRRATDQDMLRRYQSVAELSRAVRALTPPPSLAPQPAPPPAPPPAVAVRADAGQPVAAPTRPCVACGKPMRVDRNFCGACGAAQVKTEARLAFWSSSGVAGEAMVNTTPYIIGRSDTANPGYQPHLDLGYYDHSYVGRRHAQIERRGLQYTITDLASTNGTYVNGARLLPQQPKELHNGDRVAIGRVNLVFRLVVAR